MSFVARQKTPARGRNIPYFFFIVAFWSVSPSYIRMIVYNYLRRLEKSDPKQDDWWLVR